MAGTALLTYGSLMFEPVWQRVTGLTSGPAARPRPARLTGFTRHAVAGQTYPALLRNADGVVDGALYESISQDTMALLDQFEGGDYQRISTTAVLTEGSLAESWVFEADQSWPDAGQTREVEVYLFTAAIDANGANGALPQAWSVQAFAQTGLAEFMARHVDFDRRPV